MDATAAASNLSMDEDFFLMTDADGQSLQDWDLCVSCNIKLPLS
jgi:hypothetical protein